MTTFNNQFNELVKVTLQETQKVEENQTDGNLQVMDKSVKSQDIFQDNNTSAKIN